MKSKIIATVAIIGGLATFAPSFSANALVIGSANAGNALPFSTTDVPRYQQVYSAAQFSGPISITSISFYWTVQVPGDVLAEIDSGNFTFKLSTTNKAVGGLSTTMNDNVGADEAVFLTTTLSGGLPSAQIDFFGTAFNYDPNAGNLLLDITMSGLAHSGNFLFLDARNGDAGGVFSRMGNIAGYNNGYGLVTGFNEGITVAAPEPATLALLGLGLGGLGFIRRRRAA